MYATDSGRAESRCGRTTGVLCVTDRDDGWRRCNELSSLQASSFSVFSSDSTCGLTPFAPLFEIAPNAGEQSEPDERQARRDQ